jgi:hypothetical protein
MAEAKALGGSGYVREFPALSGAEDLGTSVSGIYRYVEGEATHAIDWYMRHANGKSLGSRGIRYSAIVLSGIAGLLPIIASVWPTNWWRLAIPSEDFNLMPSLLIGIVALLLALDSFGDFSRGWMRYSLTAFEIRASLQEFRMNWAAEWAKLPHPLEGDRAAGLLLLAKEFVLKVERSIAEETGQRATEFAQNLAQIEKEVAARSEERQKEVEAQREAAKPGAIQLTVTNAKATDDRKFDVVLQPSDGSKPVKETVTGAQTWVRSPVAPGMYTIAATATFNQKNAEAFQVIQVKPAEIREVSLTLMD